MKIRIFAPLKRYRFNLGRYRFSGQAANAIRLIKKQRANSSRQSQWSIFSLTFQPVFPEYSVLHALLPSYFLAIIPLMQRESREKIR